MNSKQKRVLKFEYKPNCFVLVSFRERDSGCGDFRIKPIVSFLYDAGDVAAEWEVEYGPIQIFHKCSEDAEGAKEHYYYDYENSSPLSWSQLAVDRWGLPKEASRGEWDYIFAVLQDWADKDR